MKKDQEKPYTYAAREEPFKLEVDLDRGAVINGFWDTKSDTFARYTKRIPIKKSDVFYHDRKRGLVLNGKSIPVKVLPAKRCCTKMAWVAKKLRIAVFKDQDEIWNRRTNKPTGRFGKPYWCAMDTRSYWVGTGSSVEAALLQLIKSIRLTEEMAKENRKKGKRVIRWHHERLPDARKELRDAEEKARKTGFILDGVDWRKVEFAKACH